MCITAPGECLPQAEIQYLLQQLFEIAENIQDVQNRTSFRSSSGYRSSVGGTNGPSGKQEGTQIMKKIFTNTTLAALAFTMAIPLTTSTITPAHAGSRDAFVGGLVGGVVGGVIGSSRRRSPDVVYVQPRRVYREPVVVHRSVGNAHVNWCYSRYRSYDARTDTYVAYSGRVKYCNSPYR